MSMSGTASMLTGWSSGFKAKFKIVGKMHKNPVVFFPIVEVGEPAANLRPSPPRMTMNVSYLSHTEQLSVDAFEYIDCGSNSTVPHPLR